MTIITKTDKQLRRERETIREQKVKENMKIVIDVYKRMDEVISDIEISIDEKRMELQRRRKDKNILVKKYPFLAEVEL